MATQEGLRLGFGRSSEPSKRLGSHSVLDAEGAGFEELAFKRVSFRRARSRRGVGLPGEVEIRIARLVCRPHGRITRKGRGDSKLLLSPVDERQSHAWIGSD